MIAPHDDQDNFWIGAWLRRSPNLPLAHAVALKPDAIAAASACLAPAAMAWPGSLDVTLLGPRVDRVRVLDQSRNCFLIQFVREAPDDETPPPNGTRRHFSFRAAIVTALFER